MTLPEQSDRAVAQTREFLVRLASPFVEDGIKGIRREVRAEALALLRHYPYVWIEQQGGEDTATPAAAWIPVGERLPEDGQTVLVWFHGEVQTAWFNHFTNGVAYFVRDAHYNFEPTHWMPLPVPPTQ